MKKLIFALLLTTIILSCKKNTESSNEIYGKWKLTETLFDIGSGQGKYTKVTGPDKFIIFDKSGEIQGDAMPDFIRFRLIDSVKIELFSNAYVMPITHRFKVSGNNLTINPPCIEACGLRFTRE
ncbi:hypothetical protein [Pedobacter mendelii]|uniref:Lipocalin-like domain-containing protein n=1 Tax=Pedobacter mendelii TaxID=1908240 RepID=A0ABQ2BGG0_9SPHI|nr:hypothetical protein [Pedobacter mendelii]GGI25450.1 hypothetical protein GCM10008119_17720 [Pedobacter mendelii]